MSTSTGTTSAPPHRAGARQGSPRRRGDGRAGPRAATCAEVWDAPEDVRSLKSLLLFGLRGIAAYAYHARVGSARRPTTRSTVFVIERPQGAWRRPVRRRTCSPSFSRPAPSTSCACALLDEGERGRVWVARPHRGVPSRVEPGPFVVVTGHDLNDLDPAARADRRARRQRLHARRDAARARLPAPEGPPPAQGELRRRMAERSRPTSRTFPRPSCSRRMPHAAQGELCRPRVHATGAGRLPRHGARGSGRTPAGRKDFSAVIDRALELGG